MATYEYSKCDPCENRKHYMFSSFEGQGFLSAWAASRSDWLSGSVLNIDEPFGFQCVKPILNLKDCETTLNSLAMSSYLGGGLPDNFLEFFRQKIEVFHRIRAAYNAAGKMETTEGVSLSAYIFAAYIFQKEARSSNDRGDVLRWTNVLLKTLDIVTSHKKAGVSGFVGYCAREAILGERELLSIIAEFERSDSDAGKN